MTTQSDTDGSYEERQQHEAYIADLERKVIELGELLAKETNSRNDARAREWERQTIIEEVREAREAERLKAMAPDDRPGILTEMEAAHHYADIAGKTLIDGILLRKGTGSEFGPSGVGKSFLYLYRSLCLAKRIPFFGRRINEKVATLVIGFEDGHDLHLRLAAMRVEMGLSDSDGVL